jgi:cytoskeleton protein RodZ
MTQTTKSSAPNPNDDSGKKIGDILREAREREGLDFAHLSEKTRLRPHILKSLEKEAWHTFSAPVFVKGFLRSYASALHLDAETLITLYDEQNSSEATPPNLLSPLSDSRRRTPFFFLIMLLLAASVFLALQYFSVREAKKQATPVELNTTPTGNESPAQMQKDQKKETEKSPMVLEKSVDTKPENFTKKETVALQDKQTLPSSAPDQEQVQPPVVDTESSGRETAELVQESPQTRSTALTPPPQPLVLKAEVREKTWVKVILDQGTPKEYIFQPGSHPAWKAQNKFEIFIGNAAGIALEFNGKKMDNLGGHGKVIHLTFP